MKEGHLWSCMEHVPHFIGFFSEDPHNKKPFVVFLHFFFLFVLFILFIWSNHYKRSLHVLACIIKSDLTTSLVSKRLPLYILTETGLQVATVHLLACCLCLGNLGPGPLAAQDSAQGLTGSHRPWQIMCVYKPDAERRRRSERVKRVEGKGLAQPAAALSELRQNIAQRDCGCPYLPT